MSLINKMIREAFPGLEVVEARQNLRLQPTPADADGAVRTDPLKCVFSRCVRRQYGSTQAIFWRRAAYIDLIGDDGVRRVERFNVPVATELALAAFDRGEPYTIGRAYILHAPRGAKTLKRMRVASKRYAKTPHGRSVANAHRIKKALKEATARKQEAESNLREMRRAKPNEAKLQLATRRVQQERARIVTYRAQLAGRELKDIKIQPRKFDLTVRSGLGRYNFIRQE